VKQAPKSNVMPLAVSSPDFHRQESPYACQSHME
jgi:hypothetical protein